MKKLLLLGMLFSSQCFAIDPYTVIITQEDPTGSFQQQKFIAKPVDDGFLKYNYSTNLMEWAVGSSMTVTASQISDTSATGRSLMTAADAAAARSAIGAGTSNFNGAYSSLTGRPTNLSQFTNDAMFITSATAPVTSVNAKTGSVSLIASDVGAAASSHAHTASQISDSTSIGRSLLTAADQSSVKSIVGVPTAVSQLTNDSSYATTTALTSGLAGKFNNPSGTTLQYVRGDGSLAAFPVVTIYSGATDASGNYTVTYPSAYGSKPKVIFAVEGGTNKDTSVLTSTTATGFTILVQRRTDVVGLLPTYAAVVGAVVNVSVTQQVITMSHEPIIPTKWVTLSKADTFPPMSGPIANVIRCTAAGDAVMGYADGSTITFTMVVGEQIAGRFYTFRTASTASLQGGLA